MVVQAIQNEEGEMPHEKEILELKDYEIKQFEHENTELLFHAQNSKEAMCPHEATREKPFIQALKT